MTRTLQGFRRRAAASAAGWQPVDGAICHLKPRPEMTKDRGIKHKKEALKLTVSRWPSQPALPEGCARRLGALGSDELRLAWAPENSSQKRLWSISEQQPESTEDGGSGQRSHKCL